jgi:halocyanin-like protein
MDLPSRREFLRASATVTVAGLAGCGGDGDTNGDSGDAITGDDYPTIDEWLTETDIGDATGNYDGTFVDATGSDTVTVDVGADGNSGNFAFAPSALVVSTDTEIQWSWTGEGNLHNVKAVPDEQLGESDYSFSSGDAVSGSGVKYTQTMDEAGIALYHCQPHLSLGMKGGIAVR